LSLAETADGGCNAFSVSSYEYLLRGFILAPSLHLSVFDKAQVLMEKQGFFCYGRNALHGSII